ncbi:MAG: DUF58 domain-containing protein [Candidatus Thermoplasmatota archaeon]|nr:DUF58 domain-containing protein [Candidatus Thermoplasmatota archaeon]
MNIRQQRPFAYLVAFVVAGVILGNLFGSWVYFTVTIFSLSILVMSVRSLPPKEFKIDIERGSAEEGKDVYVDDELEITINIKNEGGKIRFLEIHDIIPGLLEVVEGSNHQVLELDEGEERELNYKISCPINGNFELGPVSLRYRDALNLFSNEMEIEEEMELRVLPRTEDMQKIDLDPSYTKHWLGEVKSKSIGVGSEFFAIREYQPGDELRDINWKATAKYFDPLTNEYEGERSGDVILIVDGYEEGIVGTMENNTMRASIDVAASLAEVLLSARHRVGLIISGEYMNWVYPGTGRNHYHKIMSNLTKFERGGTWGLEGIKWLLEEFFPRKSMIILVSPLTVPSYSSTLIDLCMKEYDVVLISPDPLKIEKEVMEDEEYEETAERLYSAERERLLEKLWDHGTTVVDWDPTEPLEPTLEEVLRYRHRRR